MVSFLLRPGAARFPLFVASIRNYTQWVTIGGDPADLDSIDPAERRIPYHQRGPSLDLAQFNPSIPWACYQPTSLVEGVDPLASLIVDKADHEIVTLLGGQYYLRDDWKEGVQTIAAQIETACDAIGAEASSLFARPKGTEPLDFSPRRTGDIALGEGFRIKADALRRAREARAAAIANTGFLAWFTHSVDSWALSVDGEVSTFVKALRLGERAMRGCVLNLLVDYHWIDLQLLIEHEVPIHYIWTPAMHYSPRFVRASPWLIARTLELRRFLGREPTDEEVFEDQPPHVREALNYDRYFQQRRREPECLPARVHEDTLFWVEYFNGWLPHELKDPALIKRARMAYMDGDPAVDPEDEIPAANLYIYRWVLKGGHIAAEDDLADWEIFDTPASYREGRYFHGRELRRLSCAPLPVNLYEEGEDAERPENEVEEIELQYLSYLLGQAMERERHEEWELRRSRMPPFDHDSRDGHDSIPSVPRIQYSGMYGQSEDGSDESAGGSLLRRLGPPPSRPSLAARLGIQLDKPPVRSNPSDSVQDSARATDRSQSRGRSRGAASSSPLPSARRMLDRRSASPAAARREASAASSASGSAAARDYRAQLPDPSGRFSLVTSSAPDWVALVAQHHEEARLLKAKLSPFPLPRLADVEARIMWEAPVVDHDWLVLARAQDQVRVYILRILERYRRAEDALDRLSAAAIPLVIARPQSMYPSAEEDGALDEEEERTASFVNYSVGGKTLFRKWRSGVKALARRPDAAALYYATPICGYVLRRWAWNLIADKVGAGPCRDTQLRRSGEKHFPGGSVPSLFHDFADAEQVAYLHGCFIESQTATQTSYRHAFPPPNVWSSHWPSSGEWGVEEQKFADEIASALEEGTAEIPTEAGWKEKLRQRGRSNLGSGFRKYDALRSADAEAWARFFERVYGGNRKFVKISDLATGLQPRRLFV
ncbi:uncharacterized protein SCHCODRAFT_02625648 [Schizophyllum commune H4-8]|nr:uncharacterized protein SCHCODRAFT_02625648 [Schizophyllum commune H4-8]KAI5892237.1 hypothetical protein SCHCODRAFT_02625648 [Schizophyllum commune H4-8]